jgi:hypothetical protein
MYAKGKGGVENLTKYLCDPSFAGDEFHVNAGSSMRLYTRLRYPALP